MNSFIFDIWLHVGREGRCFSYQDGNNLDIDLFAIGSWALTFPP